MANLRTLCLLTVILVSARATEAAGIRNADFEASGTTPSGWMLFDAKGRSVPEPGDLARVVAGEGVKGSRALRMSPPAGVLFNAGQEILGVKPGERVLVECQVRCEKLGGYAGLWLMGVGSGEYVEADRSALRGTRKWVRIHAQFVAGEGCRGIRIKLGTMGPGTVWFDELHLLTGDAADRVHEGLPPNPFESHWGLFSLRGRYRATVQKAGLAQDLVLPIPIIMDGQCPISFSVRTEPEAVLKSLALEDRGEANWTVKATLLPDAACNSFEIQVDAVVLSTLRDYSGLDGRMKLDIYKKRGAIPDEARPWLEASATVQAKDSRIRTLARLAKNGAGTLGDLIKGMEQALQAVHEGYRSQEYAIEWDAVTTLKKRTGCCGNANLAAAVFRACGIPARILAGHPPRSGPHATHYVVEYFVPDFGWVLFEPSALADRVHPCDQIEVSRVSIEDENAGIRRVGIGQPAFWKGTPLYSVPELLDALSPAEAVLRVEGAIPRSGGEGPGCTHEVTLLRKFGASASPEHQRKLVDQAPARWAALLKGGDAQRLGVATGLEGAKSVEELSNMLESLSAGK